MDYEQKYEEALERARDLHDNHPLGMPFTYQTCEKIFPELCESFGEFINELSKQFPEVSFAKLSRIAIRVKNWLEKQGEQASTWSKEDDYVYNEILKRVADKKLYEHDLEYIYTWLKSIKPQKHWKPSEQNIKDLEWCADLVKDKMGVGFHRLQVFIDELKSL